MVPTSGDTVIIGAGAVVQDAGGVAGKFAQLNLAEGATLAYGGSGGDFNGEIWNINGTITTNGGNGTYGIGGGGAKFNFGVNGSLTMAGGTQNDLWANGNALTITGVIDLGAAPAGTLVERPLFSWSGNLSSGFGSITDSFTELNGLGLVQVADNTDVNTLKAGQYSFQTKLARNGSIGVAYVTTQAVPEPGTTALLGLGGLVLILRRRK